MKIRMASPAAIAVAVLGLLCVQVAPFASAQELAVDPAQSSIATGVGAESYDLAEGDEGFESDQADADVADAASLSATAAPDTPADQPVNDPAPASPTAGAEGTQAAQTSNWDAIENAFMSALVFIAVIFLTPTVIAFSRKHRYRWLILILNLTVAFTGLGWVAILVLSLWPKGDAVPVEIRDHRRYRDEDLRPPKPTLATPLQSDHVDRLSKLGELRASGVLSEAEFAEKKNAILSGI